MRKKLLSTLSCLLVMFLLVPVEVNAAENKTALCFFVSSSEIENNNQQVPVSISIQNNPGFASADITIMTDLKILSIESDAFDVFANPENGKVNWSRTTNDYRTGDILQVVLEIPNDAKEGDAWDVEISITRIVDENVQDVPTQVTSGSVRVAATSVPKQPATFWEKTVAFFQKAIDFIEKIFRWIFKGAG